MKKLLLLATVALCAAACGDKENTPEWTFDEQTGTLTLLRDHGRATLQEDTPPPWEACGGVVKHVAFGSQLRFIRPFAFFMCDDIEEIIVPESIDGIGHSAFVSCTGLRKVRLPEWADIYRGEFAGCTKLEDLNIPHGCTHLGIGHFDGLASLKKIELHDGIIQMFPDTFNGSSIEEVTLHAMVPPFIYERWSPPMPPEHVVAVLRVPAESLAAYRAAEWYDKMFEKIEAI